MYRSEYILIFILAALLGLQGCSKYDEDFARYADSVTVSTSDNALRAKISVHYNKSCAYQIKYWEKESGEVSAKYTKTANAAPGDNVQTLKFLAQSTDYQFQIVVNGKATSKIVDFRTKRLPPDIPVYNVEMSDGATRLDGAMLQWDAASPGYVTLSDFDGKIIWYQAYGEGIRTGFFDAKSGHLALLTGFKYGEDNNKFKRVANNIIISDLNGNILFKRKPYPGFIDNPHHEFSIMPDGNLLILGNIIKDYNLSSIDPKLSEVPIWGDGFFVTDPAGKIIKQWDCFKGINPLEADYVDPVKFSQDYLHANSVTSDSEGNYYMTFNRISELWKIDGNSGDVIYRLGANGNIDLKGGDYPKGGLHAATVLAPDRILCYDNGSNRGYSRAVVFNIDAASMTAKYDLVVNLPKEFSSNNRSNAQIIGDNIILMSSTVSAKAVFATLEGDIIRVLSRSGISYRAYWIDADIMNNL